MKTRQVILFVLLISFLISGCKQKSVQSKSEVIDFALVYQTGPNIQQGGEIDVWLENKTDQCISFPSDFDIKIYLTLDDNVVQVSNRVTYLGDESITIRPQGELFSEKLVFIKPDLTGLVIKEPIDGYALLTGHLCEDKAQVVEKKVAFVISP